VTRQFNLTLYSARPALVVRRATIRAIICHISASL